MKKQEELGTNSKTKNSKSEVSNSMAKVTSNTIKKLLTLDKPNLNITISFGKLNVDANPEVYDSNDIKRMNEIVNIMAKNIIIDKTYVQFKGNRWKDAFLIEDRWYEFMKIILKSNFGRKCGKKTNEFISETLMAISITYLYDVLEKFGYEISDVEIEIPKNCKFSAEYEIDERTSWNQ